jgi:RNA polymerase sigma-70 factor (ECF subfamily)
MQPETFAATLYASYESPLLRYAQSLTGDYDQAADLVQEAIIRAAAHTTQLDSLAEEQRRAWLYTVVKNRFIDQLRSARRRQELLRALGDLAARDESSAAFAGEVNLFERLPVRFRSLLVERYVEGLTSDEIALRLGVPAATVRSRIRLAIHWLRDHPDEWN